MVAQRLAWIVSADCCHEAERCRLAERIADGLWRGACALPDGGVQSRPSQAFGKLGEQLDH
jgi:hypothetical protein